MSEPAVLRVKNLTVAFGHGKNLREVVHGVSFEVRKGRFMAIVGESGSGKSTTAHAIMGLIPEGGRVAGGSIWLDDLELTRADAGTIRSLRGRLIGLVPQDPHGSLDPLMRVGAQSRESVLSHFSVPRAEADRRIIDSFRSSGLADPGRVHGAFPHELSGGMKQRALIAAATVSHPALLIADEPTSALDASVQRRILDRIEDLVRETGVAVLFITHNLGLAAERADEVLVMRNGSIVERGRTHQIWTHPTDPYTRQLIEAIPDRNSHPWTTESSSEVLLEAREVTKVFPGQKFPSVDRASFALHRGRILGLIGESGSGKTTLGGMALGLVTPTAGRVLYGGKELRLLDRNGRKLFHKDVQVIFQNPHGSLDPLYSVEEVL